MDKKCFLIGGQKGGTGKSTVATNLATMFTIAGHDTLLLDLDSQRTSTNYVSRRSQLEIVPTLCHAELSGGELAKAIVNLYEKHDVVVIDVGGQDSEELRAAMLAPCVTLMIVPIQAGHFDIETLLGMDSLVNLTKFYNQELDAKCLINRASTHHMVSITREAKDFIASELKNLEVLNTMLHQRSAYSYAAGSAQCVVEYEKRERSDGKASSEMLQLYREIAGEQFDMNRVIVADIAEEVVNG